MSEVFIASLSQRVGEHRIKEIKNPLHPEQELILLFLEFSTPVTVLMTKGLNNYRMPVTEKFNGKEYNELCFVLPSYWDYEDSNFVNYTWMYDWIFKLETFVRSKETWFGQGHTIPAGNPAKSLSSQMKQNYFFFMEPQYTNDLLMPFKVENRLIHVLCIVPIFSDELDYKMGKGTNKFLQKFFQKGFDERLDDYRKSILATRFKLF